MKQENSFLPSGYKIPSTSNYFKFEKGENRFRILSSAITGYEYWNDEKKPVRSTEMPRGIPQDIGYTTDAKTGDKKPNPIRHFWAFLVWSYKDERVQLLEITQSTIMTGIQTYASNPKWGNPTGYDLIVKRDGDGLASTYTVASEPHSPLETKAKAEWEARKSGINLAAFIEGREPFGTPSQPSVAVDNGMEVDDAPNPADIPF